MKRLPFIIMQVNKSVMPGDVTPYGCYETYKDALFALKVLHTELVSEFSENSKTTQVTDMDNGGFWIKKFDPEKKMFCKVSRYDIYGLGCDEDFRDFCEFNERCGL